VTGAAQGIGKATSYLLAQDGATVVMVDRVGEACRRVGDDIASKGGKVTVVEADLETSIGVERMVQEALAAHGLIDISIHNVGGTMWTKPFWEYQVEEIEKEVKRSLWPTLLCCRAVLPVMMSRKSGSIVNIGSVATRGVFRVPYAAAKGGVAAMTVAMAMELAEHGIRVNCVAPGGINSNRLIPRNTAVPTQQEKIWREGVVAQTLRDTPMARFGEAEEVAAAIAFLASDQASYITGEVMYVSGGAVG